MTGVPAFEHRFCISAPKPRQLAIVKASDDDRDPKGTDPEGRLADGYRLGPSDSRSTISTGDLLRFMRITGNPRVNYCFVMTVKGDRLLLLDDFSCYDIFWRLPKVILNLISQAICPTINFHHPSTTLCISCFSLKSDIDSQSMTERARHLATLGATAVSEMPCNARSGVARTSRG